MRSTRPSVSLLVRTLGDAVNLSPSQNENEDNRCKHRQLKQEHEVTGAARRAHLILR